MNPNRPETLEQAYERIDQLEKIIHRLYEDLMIAKGTKP